MRAGDPRSGDRAPNARTTPDSAEDISSSSNEDNYNAMRQSLERADRDASLDDALEQLDRLLDRSPPTAPRGTASATVPPTVSRQKRFEERQLLRGDAPLDVSLSEAKLARKGTGTVDKARHLVNAGCVTYVELPDLYVVDCTRRGRNTVERTYNVKLRRGGNECTCASGAHCVHIYAAKILAGRDVQEPPTVSRQLKSVVPKRPKGAVTPGAKGPVPSQHIEPAADSVAVRKVFVYLPQGLVHTRSLNNTVRRNKRRIRKQGAASGPEKVTSATTFATPKAVNKRHQRIAADAGALSAAEADDKHNGVVATLFGDSVTDAYLTQSVSAIELFIQSRNVISHYTIVISHY